MNVVRIKEFSRRALYYSGLLAAIHCVRNRHTLTTLMFHRVLPRDSVEFSLAEREFTFSVEGFASCLDFIQKHYNVVRLADVHNARLGGPPLPPNAALITFDDGWRDTLLNAYQELKKRNLTALLFVATEAINDDSDMWWQYRLVNVLQDRIARNLLVESLQSSAAAHLSEFASDHEIAGALSSLPVQARIGILSSLDIVPKQRRQMLRWSELAGADRVCIEIGAHGHTHAPLTHAARPMEELQTSFAALSVAGHPPVAMSFPHGAYDMGLVAAAKRAGFLYIFTSDPELTCVSKGALRKDTYGRIHVPENNWTCSDDSISYPKLATFLFFRSTT